MAANVRFSNPKTLAKPPGYSYVVEATGPNRLIFIAGQLGLDMENKLVGGPGDFGAQAEKAIENLKLALADAGATAQGRGQDQQLSRRHVAYLDLPRSTRPPLQYGRAAGEHDRRNLPVGAARRVVRDRSDRGVAGKSRESGEDQTGRAPIRQKGQGAPETQVGITRA